MGAIRSRIDEHTEIEIEVEEVHSAYEQTGVTEKATKLAEDAFERAIEILAAMARRFAAAKSQFGDDVPQEFEVSFGVKITGGGDIWIAKIAGEAQISAKIVWKK